MNSPEAGSHPGTDDARKIRALVELCQALTGSELHVGLSDARPALSVRASLTGKRLWISVESETFVWRRTDKVRRAVTDPEGAAAEIVAHLRGHPGRPADRP
jgi:hypothetical protein